MHFGIVFANTGPFSQPDAAASFARAAEAAGFESLWTVEHVVVPQGYESTYPYDPSGKMPGGEEIGDPRPADLVVLRGRRDLDDPPGDRHPDPAPAQPRRAGQGARDPGHDVGRSTATWASVWGGSRRSSTPSGCPSPAVAPAPTSTSRRCGPCGPTSRPRSTASTSTSTTASCCRPDAGHDPDPRGWAHRGRGPPGRAPGRRVLPREGQPRGARPPVRDRPLDRGGARPGPVLHPADHRWPRSGRLAAPPKRSSCSPPWASTA